MRILAGTAASRPTRRSAILRLRPPAGKNLLATPALVAGLPMLLAGDEFLRTQLANNNAWCRQRHKLIHWLWRTGRGGLLALTRQLIALRKPAPGIAPPHFFRGRGPAATWSRTSSGTASSRTRRTSRGHPHLGLRPGRQPDRPRAGPRPSTSPATPDRAAAIPHAAGAERQGVAGGRSTRRCRHRWTSSGSMTGRACGASPLHPGAAFRWSC